MQKKRSPEYLATSRAFGQRVRTARDNAGLTQIQLQELLTGYGVHFDTSAITRVESGEREPRLTEALAIADILGISLTGLMSPPPDVEEYVSDVHRLMDASKEALHALLRAVERAPFMLQRNEQH